MARRNSKQARRKAQDHSLNLIRKQGSKRVHLLSQRLIEEQSTTIYVILCKRCESTGNELYYWPGNHKRCNSCGGNGYIEVSKHNAYWI